jgi:hypothetical protein
MTIKWLAFVGLALTACGSDDNGPAGDGKDTLPKRGELSGDPTIVSATAQCSWGNDDVPAPGDLPKYIELKVAGSDPAGQPNLGTCSVTMNSVSDQDSFGTSSNCYMYLNKGSTCNAGEVATFGITVSNDTGGVTTASVKLTVAAVPQ